MTFPHCPVPLPVAMAACHQGEAQVAQGGSPASWAAGLPFPLGALGSAPPTPRRPLQPLPSHSGLCLGLEPMIVDLLGGAELGALPFAFSLPPLPAPTPTPKPGGNPLV